MIPQEKKVEGPLAEGDSGEDHIADGALQYVRESGSFKGLV